MVADPDSGLDIDSAAQCQHVRAVAAERVTETLGNVGEVVLSQIRETLAVLLDL
jgi:mRNA interferase MazF